MKGDTVKLIYFSPTGTTKKILQAMAQGMSVGRIDHLDLTRLRRKPNYLMR